MIVEKISKWFPFISGVIATDGNLNLKGQNKANYLVEKFGSNNFIYIGNDKSDLKVWKESAEIIAVNCKNSVIKKAHKLNKSITIFDKPKNKLVQFLKSIRVHQFSKNILIFLPLFLNLHITSIHNIYIYCLSFCIFCLNSASCYILNDLLDLNTDRAHHRKQNRSFASGNLSIIYGITLFPLFFILSLLGSYLISIQFFIVLVLYSMFTLTYSFIFKKYKLIDVFILATLYVLRIIAGIVILGSLIIVQYYWFLSFSIFLFLSLAIMKRYIELVNIKKIEQVALLDKEYTIEDILILKILGITTAIASSIIMFLYMHNAILQNLYSNNIFLWFIAIIFLYWIIRLWMLAVENKVHEDPVVFCLKDRLGKVIGIIIIILWILAI